MAPHRNGNDGVTIQMRQRRYFQILTGFNFLEGNKVMNSKKIILLGCVAACVFAASTATAQMRGHGGSMGGMGMRGPPMSHSMGRMGMRGGFMPHSMGGMPMHRGPMMNSPSGFRRFGNRDFNRNDRFGRFNRFNDGRFVRNHRFHHFNHFNHFNTQRRLYRRLRLSMVVGLGLGSLVGLGLGLPVRILRRLPTYGSGYGYSDSSGSRVAELQSRLASAGYYHGAIDGIMGPATRRAIRAYERDHGYVG